MARIVQVTVDYAESRGGVTRCVSMFQQSTGSHIISINHPDLPPMAGDDLTVISADSSRFGIKYAWCPKRSRIEAEQILSEADLIICHQFFRFHLQWVWGVLRSARIPYWIVPHGCLDPYVFTYRRASKLAFMSMFGKRLLENADSVIFASESEKAKASAAFRISGAQVVHWSVEIAPTLARAQARFELRKRFDIPLDARIVLYVGRLHSTKRPFETIDALATADEPSLHLLMVGPPDDLTGADLITFAKGRGFQKLHLAGPLYDADKFNAYLGSDLFISLSAKENFGYTIVEALASRLPILIHSNLDLANELSTLDCGWILTDSSVVTAAAALKKFARASDSDLEGRGERGASWARRECSQKMVTKSITELVKSTLQNSRKSAQ